MGPWNIRKSRKPCCPITGIWFWYSTDYSSPGLTYTDTRRQTHTHIHEQFQMTYHYHANDHSRMPRHKPPLVSLTIHSHCPGKHLCSTHLRVCQPAGWGSVRCPFSCRNRPPLPPHCRLQSKRQRGSPWGNFTQYLGDSAPNTSVNQYGKSSNLRLQSVMFNQQCSVEFINTCCVCTPLRSNRKKTTTADKVKMEHLTIYTW